MFSGFKRFVTENDGSTAPYVYSQPSSPGGMGSTNSFQVNGNQSPSGSHVGGMTRSVSQDSTAGDLEYHQDPQVSRKVKNLITAVSSIDPFFSKRSFAHAMGTVDYMSPEMASGKTSHDEDSLTDFYNTIRREHPEAANQVRPLSLLFKRFRDLMLQATNHARSQNENIEMRARMDAQTSQVLRNKVENVKRQIDQFTPQDLQSLGNHFHAAFQQFERFHSAFQNVFHHVERYFGDNHAKVRHLAWDTTRYQQ